MEIRQIGGHFGPVECFLLLSSPDIRPPRGPNGQCAVRPQQQCNAQPVHCTAREQRNEIGFVSASICLLAFYRSIEQELAQSYRADPIKRFWRAIILQAGLHEPESRLQVK